MGGVLLFAVGLAAGSFLNVVAARYRPNKFILAPRVIGGRSRCPSCRRQLRWYELLPLVSFFLQRGRCRSCRRPISWQYPIVELLAGLVFLLPLYFSGHFEIARHAAAGDVLVWYYWITGAWVLAGLALVLVAVIDWRYYLIPDETVIAVAGLGVLVATLKSYYQDFFGWKISFLQSYALLAELPLNPFGQHLAAGAVGFLFFGSVFFLTRGRGMGFGDVKLAGALGLLLGWPEAFLAYGLSFILGAAAGLVLLALGRKKFSQPIPFGPSLVLATFITVLFGYCLVDGYVKLFGIF